MLLKKKKTKQVTRKHTQFEAYQYFLNAGKKEKKISLDNLHEKATYGCSSVTKSCPTLPNPWTAAHKASLSFTVTQS